jgi:hypothetical protein
MRQWQRWGMKLPGKDSPRDNNIPKGVDLGGMVNIGKLSGTYRHAENVKVVDTHWPKWQEDKM